MRNESITRIREAIEHLAKNPPETPMGQLQAALLIAEASDLLADVAERKERYRRRTTLPEGYRVLRRKPGRNPDDEAWILHLGATKIGVARSREQANALAWDHRDDPELFEGE